jgi:DNA-binding NtrC family response regulator
MTQTSSIRKGKILVVDDEKNLGRILTKVIGGEGHLVEAVNSGEQALEWLGQNSADIVLTDMRMPGMDGITLIQELKNSFPELCIIVMTAYSTVENAVKAMKLGAYEYIKKPFDNDELISIIRNAMERQSLLEQNRMLREQLSERFHLDNMIGKSAPMQKIYDLVLKVAPLDSTVLISGESGTGKELVARAIHQHSNRCKKLLVAFNSASLPSELLESELFGYMKGAFTGAHREKRGLVEAAEGGSLFLDEVGEMPLQLQAKFLRFLETRQYRRLGSTEPRDADIRLIAATNKKLEEEVGKGNFREDLFFRLNVVIINLPPLRERGDDIPLLVDHFIRVLNERYNRAITGIDPEAMQALMQYPWPGNIRSLQNTLERIMVVKETGIIEASDLPANVLGPVTAAAVKDIPAISGLSFRKAREAFERQYFRSLLVAAENNVTRASLEAGLSRRQLYDKLKRYNLRKESDPPPTPDEDAWKE